MHITVIIVIFISLVYGLSVRIYGNVCVRVICVFIRGMLGCLGMIIAAVRVSGGIRFGLCTCTVRESTAAGNMGMCSCAGGCILGRLRLSGSSIVQCRSRASCATCRVSPEP